MMDAKLKADWVKALRSGEYKQNIGSLQAGNEFCCLGVLCKISGLEISLDGMRALGGGGQGDGYRPIVKLVGVEDLSPLFLRNDGHGDFKQHTFPEIADYIEQNL